ncbi:hypothetical protein [Sphingomonas sp. PAMC 26617]|uniref:hypothetical protein n=1 Tax=Sphingomonas sp. PAMC 26617 TaxID=1112216 RepID=UPI0002881CBA|nr:hypothetical protein [Sphingomonas sp. PAMC 26617]
MASFGTFIEPDVTLQGCADPAAALDIRVLSGYQARHELTSQTHQNRIVDSIVSRIGNLSLNYEDQCSPQYYTDLITTLRDMNGQFDRLVEVGVFMGGSSCYFAGCSQFFDFDIDMVDVNIAYLKFAYERVRRTYPEAVGRIRLFHGDLPSYTRHVLSEDQNRRYIVHHDGAHNFDQVVKDMSALYYVREQIFAVIAQDTHLRGAIKHMNFVDLALYAVFGTDLKFAPIGAVYGDETERTRPNRYEGNYFMAGCHEGVVLPMAANRFVYPHPDLCIDDFLPRVPAMAGVA